MPPSHSAAMRKVGFFLGHICWGRGREGGGDWTGAVDAHCYRHSVFQCPVSTCSGPAFAQCRGCENTPALQVCSRGAGTWRAGAAGHTQQARLHWTVTSYVRWGLWQKRPGGGGGGGGSAGRQPGEEVEPALLVRASGPAPSWTLPRGLLTAAQEEGSAPSPSLTDQQTLRPSLVLEPRAARRPWGRRSPGSPGKWSVPASFSCPSPRPLQAVTGRTPGCGNSRGFPL